MAWNDCFWGGICVDSGMIWIGLVVSLAVILLISRRSLPLGLIGGAFILGVFALSPMDLLRQCLATVTDPAILILALAMGLIPLLGGAMKESGQIDNLINNIRLPRKYLLPFSSALMGLLPMPGGALLSAPIVDKAGEGIPSQLKAEINVWFRHIFILIYPLEPALIVAAKMSGLDIYVGIAYLLPVMALATALGYLYFLRQVSGRLEFTGRFSLKALSVPLGIITIAPILDFSLRKFAHLGAVATLTGVVTAVTLSLTLSERRIDLRGLIAKMKPWNFSLIIIGMFLYQNIFEMTEAGAAISRLPLPILPLSVSAGFALGLLTGRVQLPISIIIPIYLSSGNVISPVIFALLYGAVYFGYLMSPAHPCLVVTCEYFGTSIRRLSGRLFWPSIMVFGAVFALALIL